MDAAKTDLIDTNKQTTPLESLHTMTDTKHTTHLPLCRLLDIAGELRNRIYRFVLLTEDPMDRIVVKTHGYFRPALLQTCKQVRSEALTIFYYENAFAIERFNLDITGAIKFQASVSKIQPARDQPPLQIARISRTMLCSNDLKNNWANLLRSLKCSHEYKHKFLHNFSEPEDVYACGVSKTKAKRLLAISTIHKIARTMVDQPWELFEQVLLTIRPSLGALDAKWMED